MGQSTEMSRLVSMLLWTFLNSVKFLMDILVYLLFRYVSASVGDNDARTKYMPVIIGGMLNITKLVRNVQYWYHLCLYRSWAQIVAWTQIEAGDRTTNFQ